MVGVGVSSRGSAARSLLLQVMAAICGVLIFSGAQPAPALAAPFCLAAPQPTPPTCDAQWSGILYGTIQASNASPEMGDIVTVVATVVFPDQQFVWTQGDICMPSGPSAIQVLVPGELISVTHTAGDNASLFTGPSGATVLGGQETAVADPASPTRCADATPTSRFAPGTSMTVTFRFTGASQSTARASFSGVIGLVSWTDTAIWYFNLGQDPVADFTWEVDDVDGLRVHFDAGASTGDDLRYEWEFDGLFRPLDYIWRKVDHIFDAPGTYEAKLRVQDTNFNEDTVTKTITVKDGGVLRGTVFVPEGNEPGGIRISYSGTEAGSVETEAMGRYEKFLVLGSYTITAPTGLCYVENTSECQSQVPVTIERVNGEVVVEPEKVDFRFLFSRPHAIINFTKDSEDPYTFSFDGSASTDPDDDIETYEWSFGDGEVATGVQPPPHTFADGTERTVTLTVRDESGFEHTADVKVRPGKFVVTGQFFEQVCGRPSTRAPFATPVYIRVQAHGSDGFQNQKAPDFEGKYRFEALPGEFSVFADLVRTPFANTPYFPAWEPSIRFFDLQADTPDQDFELCYDPGSPSVLEIDSRNGRFSSPSLSMRNGGLIRICDYDGITRDVSATGLAGGDLVYRYGYDTREVIRGCLTFQPLNPAPSPMHVSVLSSSLSGIMDILVVVLPGTPVSGVTTTTANALAGSARLEVMSNDGFRPGDEVMVDPGGPGQAKYTVQAIGSIILTAPLKRSYPAGTVILNLTSPPPGIDIPDDTRDHGHHDGSGNSDGNTPPIGGGNPTATPTTVPTVSTPTSGVSGAVALSPIAPPSAGSGGLREPTPRPGTLILIPAAILATIVVMSRWMRRER